MLFLSKPERWSAGNFQFNEMAVKLKWVIWETYVSQIENLKIEKYYNTEKFTVSQKISLTWLVSLHVIKIFSAIEHSMWYVKSLLQGNFFRNEQISKEGTYKFL